MASGIPFQILRSLWKVIHMKKTVCQPEDSKDNTDIRYIELVDGAKWNHEVIAKQAVRKLFGRVRSRTRLSPPSTLKELYQAGFNSLNARMCRDLLYKWAIFMGKPKGSRHVKKPSWWPETVRYASASELDGLDQSSSFSFLLQSTKLCFFGKFYAARRDINITEKDEKTLSWILSIRHVFKTDIKLPLP
ncbi:unnamed protein product [Penicillium salamii]|nr:unnamed protein product [Penicillium salamii]